MLPHHTLKASSALTLSKRPRVDDTLNPGGEEEEQPSVPGTALVKANGSRCSNQASLTPLIEACTVTGPERPLGHFKVQPADGKERTDQIPSLYFALVALSS